MKVTLVRAWPNRHDVLDIELPESATVNDALQAGDWQLDEDAVIGVWGKVQPRTRLLRDGDRVEVYRPLEAEPKTARRKRAAR